MNDIKNLFLTMIVAFSVIWLWHYVWEKVAHINPTTAGEELYGLSSDTAASTSMKIDNIIQNSQENRIYIDNKMMRGSIYLKGARFDNLVLKGYKTVVQGDEDVTLLAPFTSYQSYFGLFSWTSDDPNLEIPTASTIWKTNNLILSPGNPVTLEWPNSKGVKFINIISVDNQYMFNIRQKIINNSRSKISLYPFAYVNRVMYKPKDTYSILHEGPIAVFDKSVREVSYKEISNDKKRIFKNKKGGWIGLTDKYWFTGIVPNPNIAYESTFYYDYIDQDRDQYRVEYVGQKHVLEPNSSKTIDSMFFTGPKIEDILDAYSDKYNIPLLDRSIDFGWMYFLTKPLCKLLKLLNNLTQNFGIAILILTILVKALMFPLANKSYSSMHKMKKLQPKIEEIKEKYSDDPIKLNNELMALYKRSKISPFSGFLPMLIQVPVFFALYKVLFISLEMRHAPFFGWVLDLSAPDPSSIFNLFGLFPWKLPQMLTIGVWPIIMGLTMYLQQIVNPQPAENIQGKLFKIMPIMFTFLFSSFPVGLIIYWAWNNILSLTHQTLVNYKLADQK